MISRCSFAMAAFVCLPGAAQTLAPPPLFKQYCGTCHGKAATAGVNFERLAAQSSISESFQQWEKIATALEQKKMPPANTPQPAEAERNQAAAWVRTRLNDYARKHDGDPGRVTVRRLTSAEYAYSIKDLTGLELRIDRDLASDESGGEGFTNFGDVQFLQDAGMERYLEAAKRVANHAVIGSGPLGFYIDPGKTGFELSALNRIMEIYRTHGFRTVSGEGGRPFGLERYGKAFYAAWRFKHRAALGEPNITLGQLAAKEQINPRFAQHIWTVVNNASLRYPSSEAAARWNKLPVPGPAGKSAEAAIRAACEDIQKFVTTWPSWLFARGDLAAGGAGDESPLVFSDETLKVETSHKFRFFAGGRFRRPGTGGPPKVYLHVSAVNPAAKAKPRIIWRNATITPRPLGRFGPNAAAADAPAPPRREQAPAPSQSLKSLLSPEQVSELGFGRGPDGVAVGPDDFVTEQTTMFELPPAPNGSIHELQVEAEIAGDREQVVRVLLSDREDGGTARGLPAKALLGDPQSAGYREFKRGVLELAELLPPNSHGEPNPADKDPVPEPFDNTYNTPEHDAFVLKVKYQRNDAFLTRYGLDEHTRRRLDQAWNDLLASFEYHDAYLGLLANKYRVDLKGKSIADLSAGQFAAFPAEMRKYAEPLRSEYEAVWKAQIAARPGHVEDCIRLAAEAWRRPLSEEEKTRLRLFYNNTRETGKLDHEKAVRALLARILSAPAFLYRIEQSPEVAGVHPLRGWELASRLSYFLWSSAPDAELRRAAQAGELADSRQIERQVKRMLADPKARRLAAEFFGQWLGFYRFDEFRGIDTTRFPEFTDELKAAMHDEAISFFEHVVRKDRPVRELITANYSFLNPALAKHYGVKKEIASGEMALVEGAGEFHRGGLLRLGAVLTATSAPLRTSPVKRGDWVLRRVLGMPTPPPPADAGSIPADEKMFGGLTLREKLAAHQRNPACASCHSRIDPLGFPLESYDAVGRWRDKYNDGKPVHAAGEMTMQGLLEHIGARQDQVARTLSQKLLGYALGRTVLLSDQPLIDRMVKGGGDAPISRMIIEIAVSRQFRYRRGGQE
jgi:mono/diheme cytochrome c family protein